MKAEGLPVVRPVVRSLARGAGSSPRARRARALRLVLAGLAALPVLALLVLELLGARGDVGFLSGTRPPYGELQLASGLCYALSWFAASVVSPIVFLGLGLEYGLHRLARYASRRTRATRESSAA